MTSKLKHEQTSEQLDFENVMSTESGRNVLRWILSESGVDQDEFDENPLIQAQRNGKRLIGVRLTRKLKESHLEKYLNLIRENV